VNIVLTVLGVIALGVILSLLMSYPVMLLWNGLLPALFGFKTVTWLQAWGLTWLCHLLFGRTVSTNK